MFGASIAAARPAVAIDTAGCGTVVLPIGLGTGIPQPVATLHPALTTGSLYETQLLNLLYRPLVWVNSKVQVDWTASLASAIDPNQDDTVFRVTLKDYDWSDRSKVTAADIVYDWHLIQDLGSAYALAGQGGVPALIRTVRALDTGHVEFDLKQPVNPGWFELSGLSQFYALPQQTWGRYDLAMQQSRQSQASFYGVVDGPFRLQSLSLGRHAVFVPNRRYGGHQASIRRLVVDFLEGTDPIEALQAGQVDAANLPFVLWNQAARIRGVRRIAVGPSPVDQAMIPNLRSPAARFLDEVPVRQAIWHAIDQQRIVLSVFHGQALEQSGPTPSALAALQAPDLRDRLRPMSYDPAAARALLDRAGWVVGPDGIRARAGRRLAFSVLTTAGAASGLMTLQLIQADLAQVGIAIAIKEVEFNQLVARMLGPPAGWDAVFLAYTSMTYPDPTQYFQTGAAGNYEHYSNPAMDRLLARADTEPGHQGLYAAEDYAVAQQPIFFLPNGSATVLVRPGLQGMREFLGANATWSPEYLTVQGAMACH